MKKKKLSRTKCSLAYLSEAAVTKEKKFDGTATLQQVAMSLNFFSFGTDASDISAREPFVLDNFFSGI